jgi:hypothetical protein
LGGYSQNTHYTVGYKGHNRWVGTTLSLGPGRLHPWGTSKAYYSRGESSSEAECTSSGMSSSSSSSSRIPFSRGCSAAPPSTAAAVLSAPSGGACRVPKSPHHPVMGVPIRTWVSPIAGTGVPLLVHSCMRRSWICLVTVHVLTMLDI